jgi:hypothetical protein
MVQRNNDMLIKSAAASDLTVNSYLKTKDLAETQLPLP